MINSTFRKNGQVLGFVPQPLSTVGTAAMWEMEQFRSAEVQSGALWFLWKDLPAQLSVPPLFHQLFPLTAFFKLPGKFLNCDSVEIYFRGEKKITMHLQTGRLGLSE